jgi:hypothetical protein
MPERWLPIPGFDGYEASDRGNIRSLDRMVTFKDGRRRHWQERVLKPSVRKTDRKPYRSVVLSNEGVRKTRKVAHLVLLAHVGPKPFPKADSRHLDDNSLNDALGNLAWGTRRDNEADKRRNGNGPAGENHGHARLTEADVRAIRAAVATGTHQSVLANRYGVCQPTISKIACHKAWSHLTKEQPCPVIR